MADRFDHPEVRNLRPPTAKQLHLLRRVVATNGGGLYASGESQAAIQGLVVRHLIQGKAGSLSRIVHTRLGLDAVRDADRCDALPTPEPAPARLQAPANPSETERA